MVEYCTWYLYMYDTLYPDVDFHVLRIVAAGKSIPTAVCIPVQVPY
jgi:hypothetical protein